MKRQIISIALLVLIASIVLLLILPYGSDEISKEQFIEQGKKQVVENFCSDEKFLRCTGDKEGICRVQIRSVVFPGCVRTKLSDVPATLSYKRAKKESKRMNECVALFYPTLNQLDLKEFGQCMAE